MHWTALSCILLSVVSSVPRSLTAMEAVPDSCDLRGLEGTKESAQIWKDLSQALVSRWPDLARAVAAETLTEQQLLDVVRKAHGPGVGVADRDLVLLTADQWLRSSGTSGSLVARRHALAEGWNAYGFTLARVEGEVWVYCGSALPALAARVGTNAWADRAFLILLDQGWLVDCGTDFEGAEFGNDRFAPVLRHGEKFLRENPRSTLWASVALRVAMAHETVWSLSQVSFQRDFRDSLDVKGPVHRCRAAELYRAVAKRSGKPSLREAVERRAIRLERGEDTKCLMYYDENC